MHAHIFLLFYFIFILFFCFGGWAQLSPCGWAGPNRPSRVTGLTQLAIFSFFFYPQVCVNCSLTPVTTTCNWNAGRDNATYLSLHLKTGMATDQRYSSLLLLFVYSSVLAFLVLSSSSFLFQFVPLLVVFPARPCPSVFCSSHPPVLYSLFRVSPQFLFLLCGLLWLIKPENGLSSRVRASRSVRHERLCFFEKKQGQKFCSPL